MMQLPLVVFAFFIPTFAFADTLIDNVRVVSCYDGDTCRIDLPREAFNDDWAYRVFGEDLSIRLRGIDTPELDAMR